jgi:uncharacterized protein
MEERFEFDAAKSSTNHDKHGIDFFEAQALWKVPTFDQPSPFTTEPRRLKTAKLGERFWTAVYTLRGEVVRLISVRRARSEEVARYDTNITDGTGTDHEP